MKCNTAYILTPFYAFGYVCVIFVFMYFLNIHDKYVHRLTGFVFMLWKSKSTILCIKHNETMQHTTTPHHTMGLYNVGMEGEKQLTKQRWLTYFLCYHPPIEILKLSQPNSTSTSTQPQLELELDLIMGRNPPPHPTTQELLRHFQTT